MNNRIFFAVVFVLGSFFLSESNAQESSQIEYFIPHENWREMQNRLYAESANSLDFN